ncbi:MAG: cyclic nucleotide-binding domain-containing protein [Verrucomicrobiae bacterium]|nr:cyclic nucleotide-binding domain-containing protein [Verrucomicrobiae bacterium]
MPDHRSTSSHPGSPEVPAAKSTPPKPSDSAIERAITALQVEEGAFNDFFSFCKKVNPKEFERILREGQLVQYGANSVVYPQGENSDCFFVINDGQVEIIVADQDGRNPVPLVNLCKGELVGETGLLLSSVRSASVRVPESATLLRFDRETFFRLLGTLPEFGHYLAVTLARRLEKTTAQLHFYSNTCELSGSLDFFDLPTVFQTLNISRQHGMMFIFSLTAGILGEFAFSDGNPISARFQHLHGEEALLDLFQAEPKVNFGFARTIEPPVVENPIQIPNVNEFVMHAVHLKDEMQELLQKLNIPDDKLVKRVHAQLDWTGAEFGECARTVWNELKKEPRGFHDLLALAPFSRYQVVFVLSQLFETGQITYAELTPYGYR